MKIFIGHDSLLSENTEVCIKSIRAHDPNADIQTIDINEMRKLGYNREEDGSTEFTYTRFLVPFLSNYSGLSLFCDSDFVWQCSPNDVARFHQDYNAVSVVQHSKYETSTKMDGRINNYYERKWWSSLMLFHCNHPFSRRLTIEEVNQASPEYLHRLWWAEDKVGKIDSCYNYLVGYDSMSAEDVKAFHFTDGTPIHKGQRFGPHVEKYFEYL